MQRGIHPAKLAATSHLGGCENSDMCIFGTGKNKLVNFYIQASEEEGKEKVQSFFVLLTRVKKRPPDYYASTHVSFSVCDKNYCILFCIALSCFELPRL